MKGFKGGARLFTFLRSKKNVLKGRKAVHFSEEQKIVFRAGLICWQWGGGSRIFERIYRGRKVVPFSEKQIFFKGGARWFTFLRSRSYRLVVGERE